MIGAVSGYRLRSDLEFLHQFIEKEQAAVGVSAWHRLYRWVSGAQGALGLGFLARYLGTLRLGPTRTQRPIGTGFLSSRWYRIFVNVSLGLVSPCGT